MTMDIASVKPNQVYTLYQAKYGTPEFPILWPKLGTPQTGGEYDGVHGKYRFNLLIDPETSEGKKLIERFETIHAEAKKKVEAWSKASGKKVEFFRAVPLSEQTEKQGDGTRVATGKLELRCAQPAKRQRKDGSLFDNKFLVTDASGNTLTHEQLDGMGNGTKVRLALDIQPYCVSGTAGISVRVKKVVVTDYRAYGQSINDDDYFDDELTGSFTAEKSNDDDYGLDIDDVEEVNGDF